MGIFRRRETYNEQMLREAGLDRVVFTESVTEPEIPSRRVDPPYLTLHGRVGPKDWDAVTTVVVSGIAGDQVEFVVLPEGDLIVETEEGDGDLSPMADATEGYVSPPYRAVASRQEANLWGVGAKRIDVATFSFPDADALELSQSDGVAELRAGGEPSDAAAPVELQRLGEQAGTDYCVEATRIDGDHWEVKVSPL